MIKKKLCVFDVDGVLTDGKFVYDCKEKKYKIFGPDDNDMLKVLSKFCEIIFITADKKGFGISNRRIKIDMGFKLKLISNKTRLDWLKKNFNLKEIIYMGDSYFDIPIAKQVGTFIAPQNADYNLKKKATFVTKVGGGNRSVSEACRFILIKFFNLSDTQILKIHFNQS